MTSRLKRKLGELGIDTSSRKANENFCLIGTPLPPLEKSKDTGEFVPLWKQEVRDEKGRRRLHGAFTGGFSAGYFNTVGSKEGWVPSTFVSSRGDRAKKQAARPEDFMDDEDLQDLKDSRNLVADEAEEMDLLPGTQEELQSKNNLPVLQVNRKDNSHGLGYLPGPTLNESINDNSGTSQGPRLAGGFGLGALNDAEDDDLDVYDHSHQQSRRNVAYDYHGDDDDTTVIIGRKGDKKAIVQERSASSLQYFRDGRPVTTGFMLSNEPVAEDRWFPLPDVPPGWTPNPNKLWASEDSDKEKQLSKPLPGLAPHGRWKRSNVSADDRGAILGEIPLPSAPRSVFDYISEKDRERIQRAASSLTAPPSKPSISTKEPEDYAKAASLFKPIPGAMASRFTSAVTVDFGPKAHEGLHVPSHEEIAAKEAQRVKEEEDKISPKAHAAKMGMFGPLTRETKPWQPASRLCKRFSVKPPELPPDMPSEAGPNKAGPQFEQAGSVPASAEDHTVPVQQPDGPRDLANIGLGEDETQGQDTLTYERPSMNIFKAIFASDDEDSEDEQDKEPELDQPLVPPPSSTKSSLAGLVTDDIPVDLSTFKPTFIPREGKSKKFKDKERSKEKKEKKEKKGVLVSFAMDEDGAETVQPKQSKDRPKKKRKDKKVDESGDDVSMWADKPPPEVITVVSAVRDASPAPKGRKRAIDFM